MKNDTHNRISDVSIDWPENPFNLVLVEPEIPPNTGNIARLCAATASPLHLVEPLGFEITDAAVKRAGLDYWESVNVHTHSSYADFEKSCPSPRKWFFSTAGAKSIYDTEFEAGDYLVFGSETKGLSDEILDANPDRIICVPMLTDHVRSLNLANTVSIAVYEALRQLQED